MARKSVEYSKELEEKKKHLSAELEHEKMLLDICKSDRVRRLALIDHAMTSLSEYSVAILKLRRGIFDQELIEEKEQAIKIIAVSGSATQNDTMFGIAFCNRAYI